MGVIMVYRPTYNWGAPSCMKHCNGPPKQMPCSPMGKKKAPHSAPNGESGIWVNYDLSLA